MILSLADRAQLKQQAEEEIRVYSHFATLPNPPRCIVRADQLLALLRDGEVLAQLKTWLKEQNGIAPDRIPYHLTLAEIYSLEAAASPQEPAT